jgi:hypothetical protein
VAYLHHHEHGEAETSVDDSAEDVNQDAFFALETLNEACALCEIELIHLFQDLQEDAGHRTLVFGPNRNDLLIPVYLSEIQSLHPSRAPPVI